MTVVKSRGFSASHAIAALHSMGCAKHTKELGSDVRDLTRSASLAESIGAAVKRCAGRVEDEVNTFPCVIA